MRKSIGPALKVYKRSLKLSYQQKAFLIGSLLGDGNMRFSWQAKEANFIVDHSSTQKEYVLWKYKILQEWCLSRPIKTQRFYHKDPRRKLTSWRFFTISHPEFTKLYRIFYKNGRKIVPFNIKEILNSPFSLAVWIMDDGSRNRRALFLNTQGFSLSEQKQLQDCLQKNFNLESTLNIHSYYQGKRYSRIRITTESTSRLFKLVKKFILPSMRYKFSFYPRND